MPQKQTRNAGPLEEKEFYAFQVKTHAKTSIISGSV